MRIAADFRVAESSLRRHRDNHLAPRLANALAVKEEVTAERLAGWVAGLNERTLSAVMVTRAEQDWPNFVRLVAEALKNLELLGRVAGVLDAPTINVDARAAAGGAEQSVGGGAAGAGGR